MQVSNEEQKRMKLKRFLEKLSEDPSLLHNDNQQELRSWPELLLSTGCYSHNEPIDIADLLSELLGKIGLQACSADMMEHVMNGGTVDEFLNHTR